MTVSGTHCPRLLVAKVNHVREQGLSPGTWMRLLGRRAFFFYSAQNSPTCQAMCPQGFIHLGSNTFQKCAQLLRLDQLWPWPFPLIDLVNLRSGDYVFKVPP